MKYLLLILFLAGCIPPKPTINQETFSNNIEECMANPPCYIYHTELNKNFTFDKTQ